MENPGSEKRAGKGRVDERRVSCLSIGKQHLRDLVDRNARARARVYVDHKSGRVARIMLHAAVPIRVVYLFGR